MPQQIGISVARSKPSPAEIETVAAYLRLEATFDVYLRSLDIKSAPFDFATELRRGRVLLVGEGNLSFALALARAAKSAAANLTATTFESGTRLPEGALDNARVLRSLGPNVLHAIDAQVLARLGASAKFDLIVFQFPNVASRTPTYGRNPNHCLIRRFLRSAKGRLRPGGKVAITVVNSPYYLGVFDLAGAAKAEGYREAGVFRFNRSAFPGYRHTNTDGGSGSALGQYRSCSTWVFRPT